MSTAPAINRGGRVLLLCPAFAGITLRIGQPAVADQGDQRGHVAALLHLAVCSGRTVAGVAPRIAADEHGVPVGAVFLLDLEGPPVPAVFRKELRDGVDPHRLLVVNLQLPIGPVVALRRAPPHGPRPRRLAAVDHFTVNFHCSSPFERVREVARSVLLAPAGPRH